MSLGATYIGGNGLLIHDTYFGSIVTHCLISSNSAPLQSTSLRNLNNTDFDLSWSLSVKCTVAVDLILVSNSKHMSMSHALAVIGT